MCHNIESEYQTCKPHFNLPSIPPAAGRPRLRYGEIEPYFRCPVVGMCLSLEEQKRLLKKTGINPKKMTAFSIHEVCVAGADREDGLSEKVDALLNRKYASEIASLSDLEEAAFMEEWTRHFRSGEFAGAFWAAVTRKDLSPEASRRIFGAVHMSMHENAGETGKLRMRIAVENDKADELVKKNRELASRAKSLERENRRLKSVCDRVKRQAVTLEEEKLRIQGEHVKLKSGKGIRELEASISEMEAEKEIIINKYSELKNAYNNVERKNLALEESLEKERAEFDEFKEDARELIEELAQMNRCDQECPSFDLCRKRILIVGGMSRMTHLYRRFIESSGGVFEYHDGYVKKGVKTLEERLKRADIVLCSVSCNSHGACSAIKNMGKKHNKPVRFLFNSSLNAVSQALNQKGEVHDIQH
jgi:hypothetical protein